MRVLRGLTSTLLVTSTTLANEDITDDGFVRADEKGCANLCRMKPVDDCSTAANCKNSLILLDDGRIRPCGLFGKGRNWRCEVWDTGKAWWDESWACDMIDGEPATLESVKAYCNESCYIFEDRLVQYQCPIGAIASLDPTKPGPPAGMGDWFDSSIWEPFGAQTARRKYRWGQEPDMNERGRREACLNMCSKAYPGKCIYQGCRRGLDMGSSCKETFTVPTAHNNGEGFTTCAHTKNGSCHKEVRKEWKCHKINGEVATLEALWKLCDGKCYNWGADANGNHEVPCPADALAALPDPAITSWATLDRMNSQLAKTACPGEDPIPTDPPTDPPTDKNTTPTEPAPLPTESADSEEAEETDETDENEEPEETEETEEEPEEPAGPSGGCSDLKKMDKCMEQDGCTWTNDECVLEEQQQDLTECLTNKYYKKAKKDLKKARKKAQAARDEQQPKVDELAGKIADVKPQIKKRLSEGKNVSKQEKSLAKWEKKLRKANKKLAPAVFFLEKCDKEA